MRFDTLEMQHEAGWMVGVYGSERSGLVAECLDLRAACTKANSAFAETAEAFLEMAVEFVQISKDLEAVGKGLRGTDGSAFQRDYFARSIDDASSQSNEAARDMIRLVRDLIERSF